jgi:DNA helicase IV
MSTHPDVAAEQAYIDHAYECLDRMRTLVERAADAGEAEFAQAVIEAWSMRRLQTFADAERGLCFGRFDLEGGARPLYVGRRWVHDADQDVVVVNWQAPAAKPFYTATPVDPQRVALRRRFRVEGRKLLEIYDEPLGGSEGDEPAPLADALLDELQRSREPHMRDIVATIQADQYRLITRDLEGILVVQGGPGTGKTAVALHRASWLLWTYRERLEDDGVLVVGPNPTFMEYVSHVLPALGEEIVEQRPVGGLVDGFVATRDGSDPECARIKGDVRMAEVLARAIRGRVRPPEEDLWARVGGTGLVVSAEAAAELARAALEDAPTYAAARDRFQMGILRRFYDRYGRKLGAGAVLAFDDVERTLRRDGFLRRVVDRSFPPLQAEDVVRRLLSGRARLAEAAEGVLEPAEQRAVLRTKPRDGWTESDVPLVDEAQALIDGVPRGFGHLIVDEAQDLTPMQLRMVARRARGGSLTILGDIAQATGPVPYGRWEDLFPHLPDSEVAVEELRLAYRVPREIMELALPLLERIAPDVEPPVAYRAGGEPRLVQVAEPELVHAAVEEAALLRSGEGTVGLIVPDGLVEAVRAALERARLGWRDAVAEELAPAVELLTPRVAKGLEFDHVVVAEPAQVLAERPGVQGLRELYVALTRATTTLVVVHAQQLPQPLRG